MDLLDSVRHTAAQGYDRLMGIGEEILARTAPDLPKAQRRKVLRGAARSVLGQGLETSIVFSANLRALIHIALMRCVKYAEAEIRIVAAQLVEIMRREAPAYFGSARFSPSPDGLGPEVSGLSTLQPY